MEYDVKVVPHIAVVPDPDDGGRLSHLVGVGAASKREDPEADLESSRPAIKRFLSVTELTALGEEATDVTHESVNALNRRMVQVFIEDKPGRVASGASWVASFLVGWSACAGIYNVASVAALDTIQGIPSSFGAYGKGSNQPTNHFVAMALQTSYGFIFLIPANMYPAYEMLSNITGHVRLNSKKNDIKILKDDSFCPTASQKRCSVLWRSLGSSFKTTFPEKEGTAATYMMWGKILLGIYSVADTIPEVSVLWSNLVREGNYHTRPAVPGFFVQNVYERWRVGHKGLRNVIATLFPGETEEGKKDESTIIRRRALVQILENASYNLRRMEGPDIRALHNRIWQKDSSSTGSPFSSAGVSTFNPMAHPEAKAAAESAEKKDEVAFMSHFLRLGNETDEIAFAREHGKETVLRSATRVIGYGIGLVGTWGAFEIVRRSTSAFFQNFFGVDPYSADIAGTSIASFMGTTRAFRNIRATAENFLGFHDAVTGHLHQRETAEYDEFLRTDFLPWQEAALRAKNYAGAIYFSSPWILVLEPIIKDMDPATAAIMLTTFFLAEPSFNANQFNSDLFGLFGEAHRASFCGCRNYHKYELNRSKMLEVINRSRDIVKHLPDSHVRELFEDMVQNDTKITEATVVAVRRRVEADYRKPSMLDRVKASLGCCCCVRKSDDDTTSGPIVLPTALEAGGSPVIHGIGVIERHLETEVAVDETAGSSIWNCFGCFSSRRR